MGAERRGRGTTLTSTPGFSNFRRVHLFLFSPVLLPSLLLSFGFFNPRPLSKVQAPCDLCHGWGASWLWESVDNGMLGTGSYKIRQLGGSAVIHTESLLLVVVSQEVFREIVHSLPILNVTVRSCSSWALFKILRCLGWRLGKLVNILGLPSLACIRLPLSSPLLSTLISLSNLFNPPIFECWKCYFGSEFEHFDIGHSFLTPLSFIMTVYVRI